MATKTDKLTTELKKNYSRVQTKEIEHKEFKIRSEKELKASTKSHQSELAKTLKVIEKNKTKSNKELLDKTTELKAQNKTEADALITNSKKVTRNHTGDVKKLTFNYDAHKKSYEDKLTKAKQDYATNLSEIEDKYTLDTNESVDRRRRNDLTAKMDLQNMIEKIAMLESDYEAHVLKADVTYQSALEETAISFEARIKADEDAVEGLREKQQLERQKHVEKAAKAFDKISSDIQKEEQNILDKIAQLDVSINSRIERQEKIKTKNEADNDQKGVKERVKEIKKLNTERESQTRILNKNHIKNAKKLETDKAAMHKAQIIALSALDKDHCALIEEKLNAVEMTRIQSEQAALKVTLKHKMQVNTDQEKHNKTFEDLECKKAVLVFVKTKIDFDEDFVIASSATELEHSKTLLAENSNKEQAEYEFKLRELKHTYDYDMELAELNYEYKKQELEMKEKNTSNKHKKTESALAEKGVITDHAFVYSVQFAKNLEYLKAQNDFAINNVENSDAFLEMESLEIEQRYNLRIKNITSEYEDRIKRFEPIQEKMDAFYQEETLRYNELIHESTNVQEENLVVYEATERENITRLEETKKATPKRGNKKQIKSLAAQIKILEHDLKVALAEKRAAIANRVVLYQAELDNAKARYDTGINNITGYKETVKTAFESSIAQLNQQLVSELDAAKNRNKEINKASKEFDVAARSGRELAIDQNKAYQSARSDRHTANIQKMDEAYKADKAANSEVLKTAKAKIVTIQKDMEKRLESNIKPTRNRLISTVASCNSAIDRADEKSAYEVGLAKSIADKKIQESQKIQDASIEKTKSEIAGREALLSFSKNEIQNEENALKKDYDTKVKAQNRIYKDQLQFEIDKISSKLTTDISNLMQ